MLSRAYLSCLFLCNEKKDERCYDQNGSESQNKGVSRKKNHYKSDNCYDYADDVGNDCVRLEAHRCLRIMMDKYTIKPVITEMISP